MVASRSTGGSSYLAMRRFHFWTGVVSALVVALLTITGILLNHSQELGLDKRFVTSSFLLDWYGVRAPERFNRFTSGAANIVDTGNMVLLNGRALDVVSDRVTGAVKTADMLVVSSDGQLGFFTDQGELIEKVQVHNVSRIGLNSKGLLMVEQAAGVRGYDLNAFAWTDLDKDADLAGVIWSEPERIATDQAPEALRLSLQNRVSLERFLQELHSGRIFGPVGVWVVDLTAIVLLVQILSGLLLWNTLKNR